MSKKIRNLIICGGIVLLLVASLCLLLFHPKPTTDTSSSTPSTDTELVTLIEEDAQTLSSLQIKNSKDEYTIELLGENKWGIKALDGLEQQDTYSDAINAAGTVYASSIIEENASDLAQYGLDKPSIVYTAKYSTGKSYTVEIGDTRSNLYLTYIKLGDSNTVYSVSSTKYSALEKSSMDYLAGEIIPAAAVNEETGQAAVPVIKDIEIINEMVEQPMLFKEFDKSTLTENSVTMTNLQMQSPVVSELNASKVDTYFGSYFGLTANSVAAANPTKDQLVEFGLDNPTSSFAMTYDETNKVKLITGKTIKGKDAEGGDIELCYLMREGKNIVYIVAKDSLKWMTLKPEEIISSVPLLVPILDLDTAEINLDGKVITIKYTPGTGEDNEINDMTATVNGEKVDITAAKKYLQLMYATDVSGINTEVPTGEPTVTFKYNYREGGKVDILEIYELADRTTIISVNKNPSFTGRAGYIEKLRVETAHLLAGESVDTER